MITQRVPKNNKEHPPHHIFDEEDWYALNLIVYREYHEYLKIQNHNPWTKVIARLYAKLQRIKPKQ